MQNFKIIVFAVFLVFVVQARALEFNHIDAANSKIGFSYKQMGVEIDGHFRKFNAKLKFDPNQLSAASVTVHVDLNSIDTGSAEGNEEVAGKLWFNSKVFPDASFISSKIRLLGQGKYEALGKLTIKGHSQDLLVPITLVNKGSSAVIEGTFLIKRADFSIGEGPWATFDTVANEIPVKFHLIAVSRK